MATSPGPRGGTSVLEMANSRFPRHNAQITGVFSLPSFYENFDNGAIKNILNFRIVITLVNRNKFPVNDFRDIFI